MLLLKQASIAALLSEIEKRTATHMREGEVIGIITGVGGASKPRHINGAYDSYHAVDTVYCQILKERNQYKLCNLIKKSIERVTRWIT